MTTTTKTTTVEAAKPEVKAAVVTVPVVAAASATKAAEKVASPAVAAVAAPVAAGKPVVASATDASKTKTESGRDRSAIVALITRLRDNEADNARDAAITLGTLPADAEAVDALTAVVRNQDHFFHAVVRAAAATSLGKMGDRRAVDALIVATRDEMAEASEEAVKALGLLGDVKALPALQAVVANADGFYLEMVRKSAAQAIERLKAVKA